MADGDFEATTEPPFLRRLVDNVGALLAYWDATLHCRFANPAYGRWFGVSPESLIGKHIGDVLGPLYELNRPHIDGVLRGEPQEFEREFPARAGGPSRYSLANYIPDVVDGVVRGFVVHVTDISERKRFEMEQEFFAEAGAVLASSLNYRQTLKAIAELVVSRVTDLCAVYILEGGEPVRLTVTPADPAKRSACEQLAALPLERRHLLGGSALETKRTQLLSDITPQQWETAAQSPEHLALLREIAPRSAIVVPMFSVSGMFGTLALASTTPGRFGERDVNFATELARRAALAIENARLYEAEQRATKARDEVLAIVAHDVRNPLASIRFAATVLEHELAAAGSARSAKSVDIILRSVDRANRLIQGLLDTTRIEAGALSLTREALGARQVLVDAIEAGRPLAASASLELRLDAREELPRIWGDRGRLLQVFENLVGNAIRFTPEGGRITVGAAPRPGEVLFWVADTGAGIPAEHLPHIFDRFWQAKRTERDGAGLGLLICKGIVEAHAGRIWIETSPGRGTTFYFTIPSSPHLGDHLADASPDLTPALACPAAGTPPSSGSSVSG